MVKSQSKWTLWAPWSLSSAVNEAGDTEVDLLLWLRLFDDGLMLRDTTSRALLLLRAHKLVDIHCKNFLGSRHHRHHVSNRNNNPTNGPNSASSSRSSRSSLIVNHSGILVVNKGVVSAINQMITAIIVIILVFVITTMMGFVMKKKKLVDYEILHVILWARLVVTGGVKAVVTGCVGIICV